MSTVTEGDSSLFDIRVDVARSTIGFGEFANKLCRSPNDARHARQVRPVVGHAAANAFQWDMVYERL